jgi:hypothetical protein
MALMLSSPAFKDGEETPSRFTYDGANLSPPNGNAPVSVPKEPVADLWWAAQPPTFAETALREPMSAGGGPLRPDVQHSAAETV